MKDYKLGELLCLPEIFAMGKLHKDIATVIVQAAEGEEKSQQQCIKVRHKPLHHHKGW